MSKPSASKKNRVGHQTVDLYQFVIDDTVARVKGEFVQEGIAEDVLDELRAIWEDKLEKTGVCSIPEPEEEPEPEAQPPPAVTQAKQELVPLVSHGLPAHVAPHSAPAPVPTQPRQPPQVLQPPQQQQQQQQQQNYTQYNPQQHMQQQLNNMAAMQQYASMNPGAWPVAGAAQYTQQQVMQYQLATAQAMQAQQLAQYQQAPGYHMQPPVATAPLPMPPQGLSSLAGHKRSLEETGVAVNNPAHVTKQLNTGTGPGYPTIPQQDGPADDGAATAPPSAAPSAGTAAAADDDDDDPLGPGDSGDELNEADDLADVDDHEEIDEESIRDVVLGQFEKVHRSKAKWKLCNLCEDKTGDPEKIQALVTAVYWINIATSQLYTPPEVLFTVEGARATIKYLAAEEIQNDVAETSIALYKLAIKEDAKFTPALRMNLCWCALNMLCMYSTAYILQHGRESYLSSIVLKNAAYIAECYVATLCYFQDTPIEQIEFWDPNYLFNMSATPAWFIALIKIRYEQDKQLNAGACSADTLSILEPPSNLAVSANKVDVTLLLNAIEHFCRMSLKIPFLIVGIPNWKGGIGLTHAHYVVRYLLDKLPVIVCDHIDKCQELGLLLPEALRVSHLAMKLAQAALGMPLDALRRAIESASKANGAPESSAETEKMAMVFSALSSISILEVFATGENHKFSCPPNLEKEFTAIGLVVFHTVQSLPESAFWDCNPESVRILSESVARMRVTDTLLSVVLPSDVQKGIERVYELAENHYRDIFAKMERMQEGGMDRKLDNLCFSAFISNNTDHVQDLDVLLAEARNASPTDTERAIKRSEVLAVLPCAYLGCTTSPGHGKSIINSKICSSCNTVRYCSVKCQKKDWKVHKVACQAVAAAAGSNK